MRTQLALALATCALALPTPPREREHNLNPWNPDLFPPTNTTPVPVATLAAGVKVTGMHLPGCEAFTGIPFAEPPTGDRRFRPPEPKTYSGDFAANILSPGCPQAPNDNRAFTYGLGGFKEDCLFLNIISPAGTAGSGAGLPVLVWIHGGSFIEGDGMTYVSPPLVRHAAATARPLVLVTLNYRLGLLGFGMGPDIAANGAANLGLRDQLLALRWVRDNIAGFGGDPAKVTVFGQSAGAIAIADLYLNASIDLFRGAIMHSGAQSSIPAAPTAQIWEEPYDVIATAAGCKAPNTTALGNRTTFECLRAVPESTLTAATAAMRADPRFGAPFVFMPSIDGELIPDRPWTLLREGRFAKIPFISGNTLDEGTWTVPTIVNSTAHLKFLLDMFSPLPLDAALVDHVFARYPDIPADNSPFGTGDELFGLSSAFKQGSALVGDMGFHSRRRKFLRRANDHGLAQTWAYEFRGPVPGGPPYRGIPHSADPPYVFGVATQENGYPAESEALGTLMMDYWINFVHYLDPNGPATPGKRHEGPHTAPYWPRHGAGKELLQFEPANVTVKPDTFREDQMAVFDEAEVAAMFLFKREHN